MKSAQLLFNWILAFNAPVKMISHGQLELFGCKSDIEESSSSLLVHTNRYKCPHTANPLPDGDEDPSIIDVLAVANVAKTLGMHDMAWRLSQCRRDGVVFVTPDGEYSWTPIRCDHRLCPWCSRPKSWALQKRLKEVAHHARIMVTLTMATYKDKNLRRNIGILRKAFRYLTQRKHKYDWVPFEKGYFWRLEVTPGRGFHPHLHILSVEEYIPYELLRKRWRKCLDLAGGKGDLIWISACKKKYIQEAAKYLSKSIFYFDPERWYHLDEGLKKVRTYGSGRLLRLPPLEKKGNHIISLLSKIGPHTDTAVLKWLNYNKVYDQLLEGSSVAERLKTFLEEDVWYGTDDECIF